MAATPPGRQPALSGFGHAAYLAVIAVLILIFVFVAARAARAAQALRDVAAALGVRPGRVSAPRREPLRAASAAELRRERTYDEYRAEVDGLVARDLELGEFTTGGARTRLADACGYAVQGGKRLRAVIVLELARAAAPAGKAAVDAADAALFVEYIHAASLVVDDLPAFDDDAERRGRASLHARAGPAVAQLAALALVTAAFQDLARQVDWIRDHCPDFAGVDSLGMRLFHDAGRALGALGAAGGQFLDSAVGPAELLALRGPGAVLEIAELKTATFFELAFLAGWLVAGGARGEEAAEVQRAGRRFGTAFQIADDLGDMARDAARRAAGKPGWNFANEYGADEARRAVAQNLSACRRLLEGRGLFTPVWREIYQKVWEMAAPPPPAAKPLPNPDLAELAPNPPTAEEEGGPAARGEKEEDDRAGG